SIRKINIFGRRNIPTETMQKPRLAAVSERFYTFICAQFSPFFILYNCISLILNCFAIIFNLVFLSGSLIIFFKRMTSVPDNFVPSDFLLCSISFFLASATYGLFL